MNYEYKIKNIDNSILDNELYFERILNEYGAKDWELLSCNTRPQIGSSQFSLFGISSKTTLIFKRALT